MAARPTTGEVLTQAVDAASDRPVFRQISDHLREAIQGGRLREGDQLPSEAQLGEHYGVTRTTARHALDVLKAEGLVVSEHGRGVFVRRRPVVRRLASDRFARRHRERGKAAFTVEVEGAGSTPSVDQIEVTEERPPPDVAERLGLSGKAKVIVRSRRYLIDGHPVELATSYIPSSLARGTAIAEKNTGPGGIYARLEDMGHQLDHYAEETRARMPLPEEVKALALAPGVPVFHLIRTAYDTTGRAVEVCDTVMSSDVYVLAYELPAR
jgi:GntR family transcriptional regulator